MLALFEVWILTERVLSSRPRSCEEFSSATGISPRRLEEIERLAIRKACEIAIKCSVPPTTQDEEQ